MPASSIMPSSYSASPKAGSPNTRVNPTHSRRDTIQLLFDVSLRHRRRRCGGLRARQSSVESGKHSVAVLEAGGNDNHIWIKIPAGFNKTVYDDSLNWGYETAPGPFIDDRRIKYPRGKVLGGSGSINGHLYVRGQAADYDMWAQLGCRGWSWSDVLPYFKRAESRCGGDDTVRGRSGPLSIEDQQEAHPLCEPTWRPTRALGLKRTPDYNSGDQEGTLLYQQMMRKGPALEPGRRLPAARPRPAEPQGHHRRPWSSASISKAGAPPASPTARVVRGMGKAARSRHGTTSS